MRLMDLIGTVLSVRILHRMSATSQKIIYSSMKGRLRSCCTKLVDLNLQHILYIILILAILNQMTEYKHKDQKIFLKLINSLNFLKINWDASIKLQNTQTNNYINHYLSINQWAHHR